jgi:hypothetical protein
LTIHLERFNINPATVDSDFLTIPTSAIDEMVDTGKDLILDAPNVNAYRFRPIAKLPSEPPSPKINLANDDDDDVDAVATS